MKKLLGFISTIATTSMLFASSAFAETAKEAIDNITANVKTFGVAIIIFSAVVTAILYMSSSVNPKLKGTAKEALVALIIGVIILSLSSQIAEYVVSLSGGNLD